MLSEQGYEIKSRPQVPICGNIIPQQPADLDCWLFQPGIELLMDITYHPKPNIWALQSQFLAWIIVFKGLLLDLVTIFGQGLNISHVMLFCPQTFSRIDMAAIW